METLRLSLKSRNSGMAKTKLLKKTNYISDFEYFVKTNCYDFHSDTLFYGTVQFTLKAHLK